MKITVSEDINASRADIWALVTDHTRWTETIDAIKSVEIIEQPEAGFKGLKWKETREMFGKDAVETMWVSAEEPFQWYEVSAENHGARYLTRVSLDDAGDTARLTMTFTATPVTFAARLMSVLGVIFSGSLRKGLQQDLVDIRNAVE